MAASSPGAIGAGNYWVDTNLGTGKYLLKVRNAGDSAFESLSFNADSPPAIGGTTPAAGVFSSLKVTGASTVTHTVDGSAGQNRRILWTTSNVARWLLSCTATPESGSNVGSDLAIGRTDDAGTFVDFPLTIVRSTGLVNIPNTLTLGGALDHDGSTVGLYGVTPTAQGTMAAATGTPSTATFDTATVTLPQLAGRFMAMITYFRLRGDFA